MNEYFQKKAISNSFLGMLSNPKWVKMKADNPELEDEETSYFRIGSAIDCLLTSKERWETDFIVIKVNRPYGFMAKFIDLLPPGLTPMSLDSYYKIAYDQSGYKMRLEKVIEKFWASPELVDYYTLTRNLPSSVTVLSVDEYDIVQKAVETIMSNEFVRKYFTKEEEKELLHQVPIYFELLGMECKALLDGILIDHKNKTIQPFDLKSSRSASDFASSFLQFGYYRQAAFYNRALTLGNSPVKLLILEEDYKVLPFRFIVVDNKKSGSFPAIIYEVAPNDLVCGLYGGYTEKGRYYKGIIQLIEDYKWHLEKDYWEMPRELYENEGVKVLEVFE